MSLLTLEVQLDHGRVIVQDGESLPEKARALLTILPAAENVARDPLVPDPELGQVVFREDPALPLRVED